MSKCIQKLCKTLGIQAAPVAAYHLEANDIAEAKSKNPQTAFKISGKIRTFLANTSFNFSAEKKLL